jgi:hypothetical protein
MEFIKRTLQTAFRRKGKYEKDFKYTKGSIAVGGGGGVKKREYKIKDC